MSGLPSSSTSPTQQHCSVCDIDLSGGTVIAEKLRGGMFAHVRVKECPGCKLVQLSPKPHEFSCNTSQNDLVDPATSIYNVKKAELIPAKDDYLQWNRDDCKRRLGYLPEVQAGKVPTLLDVGCGYGAIAAGAQALGYSTLGIDGCPERVQQAKEWFPECRFQVGFLDEHWAAHHTERYDVVVMFSMLACTRDPVSTLQGALQLLKPGGHLILDDKNVANDMLQHVPAYHEFHWSSEENFYFEPGSLAMVCKKAGLQQELQVRGVQRYGLSNLISWVDFGRPQIKRPELVTDHPMLEELEAVYRAKREESCTSDHIMFSIQL